MTGEYFINSTDIWTTWGMFPPSGKSFYSNLLRAPERKFNLTKNWPDQNGTQRALSKVTYNDRDLELTFILAGSSKGELLDRYNLLRAFIIANPTFTLTCTQLDRQFTLKYVAMPAFNKLTTFDKEVGGNEMICAELTLSLTDSQPTIFLDAVGDPITLTYHEPIPDPSIDLEDFTFELVDGYVIMSGEGIGNSVVGFDGNEVEQNYGLVPKPGFYNELLKFPEAKGEIEGVFQSRELALPFYLHATSDTQFFQYYYALLGFLLDSGYFQLDINNLNKRYTLLYASMPTLNQLTVIRGADRVVAELVITCLDDSPTIQSGLNLFDGQFTTSELGELIYTQSDYWDDKITFGLVEGELIKTIF